ncbi:hypothetical protein [Thalassolituus alkanivorans]|uniref:hypothetical protein n=1 Tax=Thalassolituus alkanivorans TaxID=2881055 RepID=UPI001E4AF0E5|nr:hypothetical protein [Thalassolituus alkanivorans]MCB2388395.1 hypothetical protein [Thalassolituus alkanivorans]MCB2423887.1 hypothetical protein [Thalassolituus alkanivorans]
MNPLKQIAELFSTVAPEHFADLSLDELMSGEYQVGFASLDFFSLEPFVQYLQHMPPERCTIYPSVDEMDTTADGIIVVALQGRQLHATKYLIGDDVSYDTAFYQLGDWSCRQQIYRNGAEVKPIVIEFLKKDAEGYPVTFITAREYGLKVGDYEWSEAGVRIIERSARMPEVGVAPELTPYMESLVEFSSTGEVEIIRNLTQNSIVYDRSHEALSLADMLEQASSALHDKILADLQAAPVANTVGCFLFEYSDQGPLPPTIALIQPHEITQEEDDYPLLWLNAPDCELFTEDDFDGIRLHGEHDALFDRINAQIEELDYEQADQLIVAFYLTLCRRLQDSLLSSSLLQTTEDFFVTAREFAACNEAVFLQQLWPEERWQPLAAALEQFAAAQAERELAMIRRLEAGDWQDDGA